MSKMFREEPLNTVYLDRTDWEYCAFKKFSAKYLFEEDLFLNDSKWV
jgi:hypothetical protein